MPMDVWFPLAIYYEDISDATKNKEMMLGHIYKLLNNTPNKKTMNDSSWTGDIHEVDQIHNDPHFEWLISHVKTHTLEYMKKIGLDLNKVDVYFQRSWPVIAKKGQKTSRHTHPNANISAVYYISVGQEGNPGSTRFFNTSKYNELSKGLSTSMTDAYNEFNSLNYEQADYAPKEGRIVLFPSKQPHDVSANECEEERVSIAFDLIFTARSHLKGGTPEFLMPSPSTWKKFE